ncbi:MAG: efflux RND transporter periplasmic adaptor subunit [Acidobacteriota bacterium]|nr:efflux RND transporter periplasmic adaptor subunit [Acidobacteriota bacterium]
MTTPSSAPNTSRLLLATVAVGSLALGAGLTYTLARRGAAPAVAAPVAATDHAQAGHSTPVAEATAPGPQRVLISPARQQTIGVRTAIVGHQSLDTTIRTVGAMAYDETRITEVHPKVAGWVERTFVDYVGKTVRRGQPLLTIYSPELVSTQHEYLLALRARGQLSKSAFAETRSGAESLLEATRDRLRLWDVSDAQVAELERTGQVQRTLTLYSPFNGVVLERNTYAGQYITPDTSTAKIADLSRIWVVAQIFEYETRAVKLGQEARIEFPYGQSTRKLAGKITFIYPDIDPQTRRARVRIEFANPGLELKPETYVTVTIQVAGGHALAVPREAVIDTGTAQYVIVALADGYFEPRPVEVGAPVDAFYPVLKGLADGDRIVTSAQFLIDSETNLQAAMQAMSLSMPGMHMGGANDMPGMDMSPKPGPGPGNATPPQPHQHQ